MSEVRRERNKDYRNEEYIRKWWEKEEGRKWTKERWEKGNS